MRTTNCTLHESRGLSRVNVAEKNYSEWLKNCYYFLLINLYIYLLFNSTCIAYVCVWFSIPCQQFFLYRSDASMISLEAALQSGILWYPSVKQKVFISRKIYLFQKSGLPLQLRFSNVAMKNPKMMSSCFIFIYEQCLFTTTSWEDLAAVVFVSNKFMSIFWRCNFPASVGLFRDNKSA